VHGSSGNASTSIGVYERHDAVRAEREARAAGAKSESRDDVVALWQLEVKAVLLCVPCCFVL